MIEPRHEKKTYCICVYEISRFAIIFELRHVQTCFFHICICEQQMFMNKIIIAMIIMNSNSIMCGINIPFHVELCCGLTGDYRKLTELKTDGILLSIGIVYQTK